MTVGHDLTWHLREPFAEIFDGEHWWKSSAGKEANPQSAAYELARRHPTIGMLRKKFLKEKWHDLTLKQPETRDEARALGDAALKDLGGEPSAVHCLCLIGLFSWPSLTPRHRDFWADSASVIKGVDHRDQLDLCGTVIDTARAAIVLEHLQKQSARGTTGEFPPMVHDEAEYERVIAQQAVEAYRRGEHLIWAKSGMKVDKAKEVLGVEYRKAEEELNLPTRRARWPEWLEAIESLENDFKNHGSAKSAILTKYRRISDGVSFDT